MKENITELLKLKDEDLYMHYSEEESEPASQRVRDTYYAMNIAQENYIAAISEYSFAEGFRYAVKLMKGGSV